jgi:putative serine protease PepD
VTDGSRTNRPAVWWSDGANDPWRNPHSQAVIVSYREPLPPPPAPTGADLDLVPRRGLSYVIVALVVGLLAGGLGGAVGFVAATSRQHTVVLGATSRSAPPAREPGSVAAVVNRVMPSVVTVQGSSAQGESLGSGFLLTADGFLLTNEHVIADVPDRAVRVTLSDDTNLPARIVGRDPESDIAVLKVDRANLIPVEIADSDAVAVGDGVIAVGSPLALAGTVTAGIVSALDRTIETRDVGGVQRYYAAIQTDAAVNRGNSGGPLFDLAGRVIGINSVIKSLVQDGEEAGNIGIAFAIPINQAARVASDIIDTGRARRTVIGARLDASATTAGGGVRLASIDEGGPAASAGLRSGDVILRLGSHPIQAPYDLIALVRRYSPGTVVTVVYRRGATTQAVAVTLVADSK